MGIWRSAAQQEKCTPKRVLSAWVMHVLARRARTRILESARFRERAFRVKCSLAAWAHMTQWGAHRRQTVSQCLSRQIRHVTSREALDMWTYRVIRQRKTVTGVRRCVLKCVERVLREWAENTHRSFSLKQKAARAQIMCTRRMHVWVWRWGVYIERKLMVDNKANKIGRTLLEPVLRFWIFLTAYRAWLQVL